MTPQEFIDLNLPYNWGERDLQLLVQRRIRSWGFLKCPDEVRIKTLASTRRSDLETWWCRYELKKELNYSELKSALGQLFLYGHYGQKICGFIPKRKCIVGLAPSEQGEYESACRLAIDIKGMGIEVIFLNEQPNWHSSRLSRPQIQALILVGGAIAAFALSFLISVVQ